MDPLDLSLLDSEQVAVRHRLIRNGTVEPREPHEKVHGTILLIDDVAAVGDLDATRKAADGAGLASRVALTSVGAALEPSTRWAERDHHTLVVEAIEIGIAGGFDHGPGVPLLSRDGVPVLDRVPVEVARGIKEPVACICHDRLHVRDLSVISVENPGTDHVRMVCIGHDELGEGSALDCVVNASVVVDVKGLGQNACLDVNGLAILGVLDK